MPGKTSQASTRGKQESKERLSSAQADEGSARKVSIWPEWSEAELASEKWDLGPGAGKGKEKFKATQAVALYEDVEGVELPPSLVEGGVCWKRPADLNEAPVIVENPDCSEIDLVSANSHLMHSELMCWVLSQLLALWQFRHCFSAVQEGGEGGWRPWEHIHPHPKGALAPQFNPLGKYCVRLYWMGAWRKVTVDDMLPFREPGGEGDVLLLPRTPNPTELWPAILTKAILKIASLDFNGGSEWSEFGDSSVIHMLTGWIPQVLPVRFNSESMWELLTDILPVWKRLEEAEGEQPATHHEETQGRNAIVLSSFAAGVGNRPLQPSLVAEMSTSEPVLKEAGLISEGQSLPSHPMLLTQVRNQPLNPPPKEPPPPTLQAPYYLGLRHRQPSPSDPAPVLPPPPAEPRFVEIVSPFSDSSDGKVWMEYTHFVKAFRNLCVFRDPSSFAHRKTHCDLLLTVENSAQAAATATKKTTSTTQLKPTSNKDANMLFVDSVSAVRLHLVFSSFSHWREGTRPSYLSKPLLPLCSVQEEPPSSQCASEETERVVRGSLVVEPYSWRSIQASAPALRIATTGTTGAVLTLPPGRHVFKLHARAPLGYHLELFSHSEFVLTDEENVLSLMSKESCRFLAHCSHVAVVLLSAAQKWGKEEGEREGEEEGEEEGEGQQQQQILSLMDVDTSGAVNGSHARVMLASALHAWSSHGSEYGLTPAMLFAWKAFLHHILATLESKAPPADHPVLELDSARRLLSEGKETTVTAVPESWNDRKATAEEHQAARVIQHGVRCHIHHRLQQVMLPGSSKHQKAVRELTESISLLQPHAETLGLAIFRNMFKLEPRLLEMYPFYKDECLRAFTSVYSGQCPPIQPNSWTIVFSEVFSVLEPLLMVPHLQSPVSSCLLRVVDNDSVSEVPAVFHSVVPHLYHPNKGGYTFIAEAWTHGEGVEGGRWQLKLVGSKPVLPRRVDGDGEEVTTLFHTHEVQEYCLPDREGHLFRFSLKVVQQCPISVQLGTSKRDAYIKLEILDHERPVAEVQGKGHAVIPIHTLRPNHPETMREGEPMTADVDSNQSHKYVLQATVLQESWPVADSAWPYISMIKSVEKLEEGRPGSEKPSSGKKGKGKEKGGGKKAPPPQPQGSQIDLNKPHWTLRIVTKIADKDGLELRKDTERADELRGMVQAWEAEQPGRGRKAQESRQKFLESRALKDASSAPEEDQSTAVSVLSESSSVPQPPAGPVQIRQMDLSPFIVQDGGSPRVLSEEERLARQQARQSVFREYRFQRQAMLQVRNTDREVRNETKLQQLEMAEQWQSNLEELRNKFNAGREAIRERQLKEKSRREAELAAQLAQEEQATAGRESKAKGKAGKGKKK